MSNNKKEEYLFHLLQDIYFDNIDTAKADEASEAMQEQLEAMTTDGRYVPSPPPQEGRRHRKKETFAELRERLENEQQAQEQLEAMTTDGYCVSPSPLEDLSPTRS